MISNGWTHPAAHQEVGRNPRPAAVHLLDAVSLLNAGDSDAEVTMTVFFANRGPAGPYRLTVPAQRSLYQAFRALLEPEAIPATTDFCAVLVSDLPIVVQHSRQHSHDDVVTTESASVFAN